MAKDVNSHSTDRTMIFFMYNRTQFPLYVMLSKIQEYIFVTSHILFDPTRAMYVSRHG